MKNKMRNILASALLPVLIAATIISCNEEDAITYSGKVVDDRISGVSSTTIGQGANLTITGKNMDEAQRVFIGREGITQREFTSQDESSISFVVPTGTTLGENDLMVVWPEFVTQSTKITVVKLHTISGFGPAVAAVGQMVNLFGASLDIVEELDVNGVSATIVSKSPGVLRFTMPAGATTGPVTVSSIAGEYSSSDDLVVCDQGSENPGCFPVINTNGSFEDGDVGVVGAITVNGWNLGGSLITSEITDEEAYEGVQSAKITINSIGANPWSIQPTSSMTIDPTATYRLSLWIKGSGIANIKFAVDEGGNPGYGEWQAPEMPVNTERWTEVSYTFSPSSEANGDKTARFAISMSYQGNVGGVLYMDNLRVVNLAGSTTPTCTYEEDPVCFCNDNPLDSKCTLLLNGGFEQGDADAFTNWTKANGAAFLTATTVADQVHSGSRALKTVVDGSLAPDQWRIQLISDLTPTEVDAEYIVTAWVKAASAGGTIRFSTQPQANAQYGPNTAVPAEWTQIQWSFTAKDANTNVVLDLNGGFATTYYIDDVRLLKMP